MLIPNFALTQTEDKLFVIIRAPYSRIADSEIYAYGEDFRFFSSPYFLRLFLPGKVENNEEPSVRYDTDTQEFTIELIKSVPGEDFKDLDLINNFLARRTKKVVVKPVIEVLDSTTNDEYEPDKDEYNSYDEDTDSGDDWLIDQVPEIPKNNSDEANLHLAKYGFGNQVQDLFKIIKDEFNEVFDIICSKCKTMSELKSAKERSEDNKFCDEHYLLDLMEPSYELNAILKFVLDFTQKVELNSGEHEVLKGFGNREYLLTKEDCKAAFLSLIDIIFAYVYDQMFTLGEQNVESAWTINKLSATLSWLQTFDNVKEVVISCMRRSLCYPLYRNWKLSMKVLDHTVDILKAGNRSIIRCLLDIHNMFNKGESRYILNQLYIEDYCVWLQKPNINDKLSKYADKMMKVRDSLEQSEIGFDIDILEVAALSTLEEEVQMKLQNVDLNRERKENGSDTSSSESTTEDSDSDSEDS